MRLFWSDFLKPTDSYAAEKTLLALTFVLGLTPICIHGGSGKRRMSISRIGYVITIVQGIFFVYCFLHSFLLDESIVGFFFKTEISKIGDILQKFIGLSGMLILFSVSLRKSRDMIAMYQTVAFIDARFLNLGVEFNYRYIMNFRHSKLAMVTSICMGYLVSSLWMLFHNQIWPSFQAVIAFFVPHIFLLSVVVLNVSFVMRFWQHFDLLNKFSLINTNSMCLTPILPHSIRTFLNDLHRPGDVYACYRVYFLMAFCIGIIPFQFSSQPTRHLKANMFGYLNILIRIAFYTFIFIYSMHNEQSLLAHFFTTDVSKFTDNLQKFNGMFGIIVVLILGLLERQSLMNLMQKYESLELHFSRIGVQFNQKSCALKINLRIFFMFLANLSFILFGLLVVFKHNGYNISWIALSTFYSPHVIISSVVIIFHSTLHKITLYCKAVNEVLKNLCHQWDTRCIKTITQKQRSLQCLDSFSMYTIVSKNPAEIIQESMEIHQLICEAASTANKYFTYQLLTIISIAFLIIVFDAYYVLETLLGKSKRESKFKTVEFVTFFSCQMILYLIAIISIVEGSNRAIKKSEKTGGIVHALLNKAKTADVKEKLQQFSMQLMHLKINFTAAGLFNIDRTLYFTISGALTTYLIILLQFTSNPPSAAQATCEPINGILANQTQT